MSTIDDQWISNISTDDQSFLLEVAAAFKWYMREHKTNQSELAVRLGVSEGRVSQILNGRQNLTCKTIEALGEALGAEVELTLTPSNLRSDEDSV